MRQSERGVVTGAKTFTRDIRSSDVKTLEQFGNQDWGDECYRALYLRATQFGHKILSIDLDYLENMGVFKCLMMTKEANDRIAWTDIMSGRRLAYIRGETSDDGNIYFAKMHEPAAYVGQPICLLLFRDVIQYLDAQREKPKLDQAIEYDVLNTDVANSFQSNDQFEKLSKVFDLPSWKFKNSPYKKYFYGISGGYQKEVTDYLNANSDDVLSFTTRTQAVDTAHLEPDSALGRVITPAGAVKPLVQLIVPTQGGRPPSMYFGLEIDGFDFEFLSVRLGGGFGGRSSSPFTAYAALATIAGEDAPVRLEYDRLEQFVAGIKRHPSMLETRLLIDSKDEIEAFESNLLLDGGSMRNLSTSVLGLSRHSTIGAYKTSRSTGRAATFKNTGVLSASMRGFGIPQALFNIEQQIDRVAAKLGEDPIAYRRRIVVREGDSDIDDKEFMHPLKNLEVLEVAANHPHWLEKASRKADFEQENKHNNSRFGSGIAFAMEAFGATSDQPSLGMYINDNLDIEIDVFTVRMGQGTINGLEDVIHEAFGGVRLVINPDRGFKLKNIFNMGGVDTNAAARGTFGSIHVFRQLFDVWVTYAWGPALLRLLNVEDHELEPDKIGFQSDGTVSYQGVGSVDFEKLAKEVRSSNWCEIYGMASFRNTWSYGEFDFGNNQQYDPRWLKSVRRAGHKQETEEISAINIVDPKNNDHFAYPYQPKRSLYASAACMVDVSVSPLGSVVIERVTVVLDAGNRLSDMRVRGQVEGGIAQGIGHTLLEEYPAGPLGGQRNINFDKYAIPRLRHMPRDGITTVFVDATEGEVFLNPVPNKAGPRGEEIIPRIPLPNELYKGISEISISPIAAAIANALVDAIFPDKSLAHMHRFEEWPISHNHILKRLDIANG